jgi:hypothetical protein
MRFTLLVIAAFAFLLVPVPAQAADQISDVAYTDPDAVGVLFEMDQPEVRQQALVRFWSPVRVAGKLLMGKYIVEHDTDRMARGEPCTHIYDFYSKKLAAAFHCTHLTRPPSGTATVSITPRPQLPGVLTEFQFAGEADAHGVPAR